MTSITLDRVKAILSLPYIQERYIAFKDGDENRFWIWLEDFKDVYISVDTFDFEIGLVNENSLAAKKGLDDHRHYFFRIRSDDDNKVFLEKKFQPIEIDENGEDNLSTRHLADVPEMHSEAEAVFKAVESYFQFANSEYEQKQKNLAPALITTIIGQWSSFDDIKEKFESAAKNSGLETYVLDQEFSVLEKDDRMEKAFRICADRTYDSMDETDWANIEKHSSVAYFILREIHDRNRIVAAMTTLKALSNILDAELALGVKIDTSGIAHGLKSWKKIIAGLQTAITDQNRNLMFECLYKAFVRKPLIGDGFLYSCGMHIFGLKDFIFRIESEEPTTDESIDSLNAFQQAFDLILSISKTETAAVEILPVKERIEIYDMGHPCWQPFGYVEVRWK